MMPMVSEELKTTGYRQAVELLRACATRNGFVASAQDRMNYQRIWSRDSTVAALAALSIGDQELIQTARRTFETLLDHQGPHGEVPSNVDPKTGRVSYGGTAGRLDGNLWLIIGCGAYWKATGDDAFLDRYIKPLERVQFLLGAWEYNNRGLLYVPLTGDWADEYVQASYMLYDQLLYLQAQRTLADFHARLHGTTNHILIERIDRLAHMIRTNYWLPSEDGTPSDVYHEVIYRKGQRAAGRCCERYWMPFFSPAGYGYRFDTMANVLAGLLGVADDDQVASVDRYIADELHDDESWLLPAFHPVITPMDDDWEELQMTFSYEFKNRPYEYHNGGLWPLVTGLYASDLARRGQTTLAERYLDGLHRANARPAGDHDEWAFPEFLHGQTHEPGGTLRMAWNGAVAVIAHHAIEGKDPFHPAQPEQGAGQHETNAKHGPAKGPDAPDATRGS